MQDVADLEHDPQVEHAGLIQTVAHPGGEGPGPGGEGPGPGGQGPGPGGQGAGPGGQGAGPGGKVRVVGVPMRFGATPGTIRSGPPAVGQHTDEVLRGLGYTGEAIRALHDDGAV